MLVMRRRPGQGILIGDGIEIDVIEISHSRVKLGIKASREVSVMRKEAAALASENKAASLPASAETLQRITVALGHPSQADPATPPSGPV
jgi:carbon storage regulator